MDVMELDVFLPEDRPKRLEQLRRKKGLDKGDVAKAIGVSNATYGRMESGGVDSITGKSLKALADLYNVSTDFILGLTDNPEPFYHDIGELGLSAEAVKHLLTDNVNPDVVNELLLNKNFRQATKSMAIYFSGQMDETYKIRNDLLSCTAEFLEDEVDINEITDVEEFQNDIKEIKSQKFTASRYEFDQIIHRIEAAVREIKKKSEEEIKANGLNRTSDLNRKVFNTFVEEYKGKSAINNLTDESIDLISYSQLNYGNYIPPLLYTDIIEDVIWISNHNSERFSEICINTEQKANDFISLLPIKTKVAGNIHKLITCRADTNLTHIYDFSNKSVIVSVDLDYFGSNDHLGELIELEITRNQFFELQNNIYNKVRCSFGSNLNVYSKDSRYYVKLFGLEPIPACKISENEIKANLATLRDFFVRHNLNPDLNIICKSESSGYTRQEVIKYFVENRINI